MGIGYASGDGRAVNAARTAISSPMLEASVEGARGMLLNVSGPSDLGLFEVNEAAEIVAKAAHPDANIIFGAVIDDSLGDEVRITVIAAGFDRFEGERKPTPRLTTLGLSDDDFALRDDLDGDGIDFSVSARPTTKTTTATTRSTSPSSSAEAPSRAAAGDRRPSSRSVARGSASPTGTAACRSRRTRRRTSALHVGDDPAAVAENRRPPRGEPRRRRSSAWVWLHQVHGDAVVVVDDPGVPGDAGDAAAGGRRRGRRPRCPAPRSASRWPTARRSRWSAGRAVGVVHAGWPGLEAGVIGRAVDAPAPTRSVAREPRPGGARPVHPPRPLRVRCRRPRPAGRALRARGRRHDRLGHAGVRHPCRGPHRARTRRVSTTCSTSTCARRRRPTTSRTAATASPAARPSWRCSSP